jgi:hypothetical protein
VIIPTASAAPSPDITVGVYYFPGFHVDPRNECDMGEGFTEWQLVKESRPRFEGHRQPKVPLWGYRDESQPAVMEQNIEAASTHGIDCFLFDWYWYEDAPFIQRPLDEGFLGASNAGKMKFALMWANHDWTHIFPLGLRQESPLLHPGAVSKPVFAHLTEHIIERYFPHPGYLKIDGKPYFSIFQLQKFLDGFGGLDGAREAVDEFRTRVARAGFPGVHLNTMVNLWGAPLIPGDPVVQNQQEIIRALGFDSLTSYVWPNTLGPEDFPLTDYRLVGDKARRKWDEIAAAYHMPYFPNVTTGWDCSPRARQSDPFVRWDYPFSPVCKNNTPEAFREALELARDWVLRQPQGHKLITLNAWNEWTEGSYLEPDEEFGMGRLEAIAAVFGRRC